MYRSFNARAVGLSLSAEHTVELAAGAGFAGVDLLVRDLLAAGTDPGALRARMADLGLRGGAWPLPVAWRQDEDRFRSDLRALPRFAAAAATLGLTRTATWVLPETPDRPDSATARADYIREVADLHVRRLGAIARILDDHGSRLGLEVIGVASSRSGRGLPFVHRLADLGPLLDAVRAEVPGTGVLVDAYHLYAAGESIDVVRSFGGARVVWVHVADLPRYASGARDAIRDDDRGLPGDHGSIDAAALLRLLEPLGYDGPVTVETLAGCRSLAGLAPEAVAGWVARSLDAIWPGSLRL